MPENIIDESIEQTKEVKKTLKDYIDDNKETIVIAGIAVGAYLIGMRRGFAIGYVRGYRQNFNDLAKLAVRDE